MTVDLAVPKRWIEGHLSELDSRAAGAEHAKRAAQTPEARFLADAELEAVHATQAAWREVLRAIADPPAHHRLRESR